jgi:hypothetical protein
MPLLLVHSHRKSEDDEREESTRDHGRRASASLGGVAGARGGGRRDGCIRRGGEGDGGAGVGPVHGALGRGAPLAGSDGGRVNKRLRNFAVPGRVVTLDDNGGVGARSAAAVSGTFARRLGGGLAVPAVRSTTLAIGLRLVGGAK